MPTDSHKIPLGHSTPAHRVHGWCSHCPGRSLAEELGAWQVDALDRTATTASGGDGRDAEVERLRTENERMRHELEVMYGGAFDKLECANGTEAHPAEHTWAAELRDPLADEWIPGTRYAIRDRAVNALAHGRKVAAVWKDGAPTERRLVRATTTYTVESTDPPTHLAKGTNAEDCPACKGTNPDYPFLCPGPPAAPAATETTA